MINLLALVNTAQDLALWPLACGSSDAKMVIRVR